MGVSKTLFNHNHITRDIKPVGECKGCDLQRAWEWWKGKHSDLTVYRVWFEETQTW